jgi:hypothetical protein
MCKEPAAARPKWPRIPVFSRIPPSAKLLRLVFDTAALRGQCQEVLCLAASVLSRSHCFYGLICFD